MTPDRIAHRIESKMEEIKSYHITGEVEIITPDTTQVYFLEQWFKEPDNYRLEMEGEDTSQVLVSAEGETWVYHPELEDYYRLSNYKEEVSSPPFILSDFWNNMLDAADIKILEEEKIQGESIYVLKVTPLDQDPHWHREKVWLDKKKLIPRVIEVYDDQDILRRIFRYQEVSFNQEIKDEVFCTNFPFKEASSECQAVQLSLEEAEDEFPFPILIPSFLPEGTELNLITLNQEQLFKAVILNYQGAEQFSIIQEALPESGEEVEEVEVHTGSEKIPLGNRYGYYREDKGVNTLFWQSEEIRYIITGDLGMEKMVKVALSMKN